MEKECRVPTDMSRSDLAKHFSSLEDTVKLETPVFIDGRESIEVQVAIARGRQRLRRWEVSQAQLIHLSDGSTGGSGLGLVRGRGGREALRHGFVYIKIGSSKSTAEDGYPNTP